MKIAKQKIVSLNILKKDKNRSIAKKNCCEEIKGTRKTAISRWTRELSKYKEFLTNRRTQFGKSLNMSNRKQCFVLNL